MRDGWAQNSESITASTDATYIHLPLAASSSPLPPPRRPSPRRLWPFRAATEPRTTSSQMGRYSELASSRKGSRPAPDVLAIDRHGDAKHAVDRKPHSS